MLHAVRHFVFWHAAAAGAIWNSGFPAKPELAVYLLLFHVSSRDLLVLQNVVYCAPPALAPDLFSCHVLVPGFHAAAAGTPFGLAGADCAPGVVGSPCVPPCNCAR